MDTQNLIEQLRSLLQTDLTLTDETILNDIPEWDSLSMMATSAMLKKTFGIKIKISDMQKAYTLSDLIDICQKETA